MTKRIGDYILGKYIGEGSFGKLNYLEFDKE